LIELLGSLDKVLHDKDHYIANEQKICWVHEIALGMRHLHKYNIVHRDLAARNILLSHSNLIDTHLKISDFGMSRVLQEDSASKTRTGIGPVCWMAPESLREKIYSKKSDVWMFGILVYEIVSRCEPHYDKDPMRVSSLIRDEGVTPNIPNDCPHKLRQLMIICWNKQPEQRPSFETICEILVQ
jgi:serine/threonine protein kinase